MTTENKLLDLVLKTMLLVRKEIQLSSEEELSIPQFRLLDQLSRGITMASELAEKQSISLPAMSNLVDGLVKRHWVTRRTSDVDRRIVLLSLSEKGVSALENAKAQVWKMFVERLGILSVSEAETLTRGLEVLSKVVKAT